MKLQRITPLGKWGKVFAEAPVQVTSGGADHATGVIKDAKFYIGETLVTLTRTDFYALEQWFNQERKDNTKWA